MGHFSKRDGDHAEQLACAYLEKQGLILVEKNYTSRFGEIDLIMHNKKYLIFIEVRYRKNNYFGGALESIDWHKQQKIMNTAQSYYWHKKNCWTKELPSRFDVVALSGNIASPEINWIENAFY